MHMVEDNKLIAEFMKLDKGKYPSKDGKGYYIIGHQEYQEYQLEYEISWDWLMPVIEKISRIEYDDHKTIRDTAYPRTFGMLSHEFRYPMFRFNKQPLFEDEKLINAAYAAVVEFINWYNKNKST